MYNLSVSSSFLSVIPTYGGKGISSQLRKPCDEVASPTIWVEAYRVDTTLKVSLTMFKTLSSSLTKLARPLGDGVDLFWGLRQCLEHLPLFPLFPFRRISDMK